MSSPIESTSLKGQFLVAMPGLVDSNFSNTVTCICEHSNQGALGLIVNRVDDALTAAALFEELDIACSENAGRIPVHIGGPVHSNELFLLHGPPFSWQGCFQVTPELAMSNTRDIVEAIAAEKGPDAYLITLGCAGWGPGQLEDEMLANAWLTCSAMPSVIFDIPVEERWEASIKAMGIDPAILSHTPGHA